MHAVSVQPAGLPVHPPKKVWVNPGEWALAFSPTQSKDGNFGFYHLKETHRRIVNICAENLEKFGRGQPLRNLVDFSTGYRQSPRQ